MVEFCFNDFGIHSSLLTYLAWAERASLYVKPSLWPGKETDTDDPEATEGDGG